MASKQDVVDQLFGPQAGFRYAAGRFEAAGEQNDLPDAKKTTDSLEMWAVLQCFMYQYMYISLFYYVSFIFIDNSHPLCGSSFFSTVRLGSYRIHLTKTCGSVNRLLADQIQHTAVLPDHGQSEGR